MNSEIKILIKEIIRIYEGSPWLGNSIQSVLKGIDPATAFERPLSKRNTIAELVAHMIAWRELLLKRLQGDDEFDVKQEESFRWDLYGSDPESAWQNLLQALDKNQREITRLLEDNEDHLLQEKVAKRRYNYRYLINGVVQHDIYHMGQIAILKTK